MKSNNYIWVLVVFILIKFILQYILIAPEYELHRDEYLYLDQGNHLDWGYLSVPPLTSWISFIILKFGNSVFLVKFFPALFGALTLVVIWKTVLFLKGNLFALVLALSSVLLSVILRLNTLYQPNSFDVLAWVFVYYCLIRYLKNYEPKFICLAAISFAIAFLNKYNIIFLAIGFIPAILFSPHRKILLKKPLYLSLLFAFLIVSPNLLWQVNQGFPVVHHMKELSETQLVNVNNGDFLKAQFLFFFGSWIPIIAGLFALLTFKDFKTYKLFFIAFFSTMLVFILLHAKDYYTIGLYPIYAAFGSVFLEKEFHGHRSRIAKPSLLVIPIIAFIPLYFFAFPNQSPQRIVENPSIYKKLGLLRWEDGKDHPIPQDFADMIGWQELAHKVDSVFATLDDQKRTLILCDNYGQAGAINFYSQKNLKADSFHADYIKWFNFDQKYVNLIRVKDFRPEEDELKETLPYFKSGKLAATIENINAREYNTQIYLFENANIDIMERIKQEIKEVEW